MSSAEHFGCGKGDVCLSETSPSKRIEDAPGTIHISAPTSSARSTTLGVAPLDSSTAAPPRVTMSLMASLILRLILVREVGRCELNATTCRRCVALATEDAPGTAAARMARGTACQACSETLLGTRRS